MINVHKDVVVKKPWGHEYLIHENENLGIWCLYIEPGKRTSLHCHPKKNTGFVVLDGVVNLQFLRGEMILKGLDKIQIFRGRFHSTRCLSDYPACIFEIEAPQDKFDLVRLEDEYGRAQEPYENAIHHLSRGDEHLWLEENKKTNFEGCELHIEYVSREDLAHMPDQEIAIFLRGGIYHDENSGDILRPGDVVNGEIMRVLAKSFQIRSKTQIMRINKK